jgi:CRP-like cAMP-binding protein
MDLSPFYFINTPLEEPLKSEDFQVLTKSGSVRKFARGDVIFQAGDYPKGIFIIKKGRAKIFQRTISGTEQILNIHIAGEIIGYRALLSEEKYPVTGTALEACSIVFVPKKSFHAILQESAAFSNMLLRYLSHEFTVWVNTISVLAHCTVKERLLLNILILVAKYQEDSKWPVKITLAKSDIACLIGTSNETLARVLKTLKSEKFIADKSGSIEISSAQQLKSIQREVALFI